MKPLQTLEYLLLMDQMEPIHETHKMAGKTVGAISIVVTHTPHQIYFVEYQDQRLLAFRTALHSEHSKDNLIQLQIPDADGYGKLLGFIPYLVDRDESAWMNGNPHTIFWHDIRLLHKMQKLDYFMKFSEKYM
jgi:hypothetical protein